MLLGHITWKELKLCLTEEVNYRSKLLINSTLLLLLVISVYRYLKMLLEVNVPSISVFLLF